MKTANIGIAVALAASVLAGCANTVSSPSGYQSAAPTGYQSATTYYGVVDSIQLIPANRSSGPGIGAVVGGVVGGLLGNQVGGGTGRTLATVAGAVGGAVVGNQIEKNRAPANQVYQVSVRINDGSYRNFETDNIGTLNPGTRVRIEGGVLYPY